jgi:hypothetical protein
MPGPLHAPMHAPHARTNARTHWHARTRTRARTHASIHIYSHAHAHAHTAPATRVLAHTCPRPRQRTQARARTRATFEFASTATRAAPRRVRHPETALTCRVSVHARTTSPRPCTGDSESESESRGLCRPGRRADTPLKSALRSVTVAGTAAAAWCCGLNMAESDAGRFTGVCNRRYIPCMYRIAGSCAIA